MRLFKDPPNHVGGQMILSVPKALIVSNQKGAGSMIPPNVPPNVPILIPLVLVLAGFLDALLNDPLR